MMTVVNAAKTKIIVNSADSYQVTTTGATNVLQYTVERDDNYSITPYVVVQNGTTTVTLTMNWTDPVAGAATYSWYTSSSKIVGVYTLPAQFVTAVMGSTITVTVTASIANNVYLSAEIETGEW